MIERDLDKALKLARAYVEKYRTHPSDALTSYGVGYMIGVGEIEEEFFITTKQIKRWHRSGEMDAKEIAAETGLSLRAVYRIVGGDLKKRHSLETIKTVCDLKRQRMPNKYIANRTGLDRRQVSDIIKRYYET